MFWTLCLRACVTPSDVFAEGDHTPARQRETAFGRQSSRVGRSCRRLLPVGDQATSVSRRFPLGGRAWLKGKCCTPCGPSTRNGAKLSQVLIPLAVVAVREKDERTWKVEAQTGGRVRRFEPLDRNIPGYLG